MTQDEWLYRNDFDTFRTVRRQTDEGAEVLVLVRRANARTSDS
jgi:hypothetical protein